MTGIARPILMVLTSLTLLTPMLGAQAPRIRVRFPAYPVEISLDTLANTFENLTVPPAKAFAALRAVYTDLKIPLDIADSTNLQIGTPQLTRTRTLGNARLSSYFNCGVGLTGDHADEWRLTMAVASFVRSGADGGSKVGTGVAAQAQDMGGNSKAPVTCGSTGLLESRIAKMVKERIAAEGVGNPKP